MAWYTASSKVQSVVGDGPHWAKIHHPGDIVPMSGIYRCLGCDCEVTSNEGDPFPPQPGHTHTPAQGSIRWRLNVRTNTKGE